ncbi:hypothetical protein A2154_04520 [Candidatus Gottesmanbacteria bacterium RBG_16_43_7]|uniref:DUF2292 domain-containing protein n=1 Tax=Candidatus Gottesmanbacteria bacterium RBG_16_43_7 TaxID=1798373 RepID=A0A1F5Z8Q0_9BACT|nr:MAG: hypothetical protein A2154_04520 [Candidatus Gottesmanbacteria bacterium RBG_16_43_7]
MINPYNVHSVTNELLEEITQALKNVSPFGSVEIYIQNNIVTQITMRNIKKTISQNQLNNRSRGIK